MKEYRVVITKVVRAKDPIEAVRESAGFMPTEINVKFRDREVLYLDTQDIDTLFRPQEQ